MAVRALPVHRTGGLEFHAWDLAGALAARGHEVRLLTSRAPARPAWEGRASDGVTVETLPHGAPGDYSPAFWWGVAGRTRELARGGACDVVHAQEFAGLFCRPRGWRGVPLVVTVHGTMFTEVPLDRRHRARLGTAAKAAAVWRHKARIALHPFFVEMLRRADRVVTDSIFTRRELVRIHPALGAGAVVVPLGIDAARYQPGEAAAARAARPAGGPLTVALLGRVQRIKGLGVVLDAADLLRRAGTRIRFVVGGGGADLESLRTEAASRGLGEIVEFHGPVPQDAVGRFLGGADLFLFPDLTQPAFGLVAVEAFLHGLPVVGARSGAIPEVVTDDAGWLYDAWDAGQLAGLLERIAADRAGVPQRAAAALELARHHTAATMAERFEAVALAGFGRRGGG